MNILAIPSVLSASPLLAESAVWPVILAAILLMGLIFIIWLFSRYRRCLRTRSS